MRDRYLPLLVAVPADWPPGAPAPVPALPVLDDFGSGVVPVPGPPVGFIVAGPPVVERFFIIFFAAIFFEVAFDTFIFFIFFFLFFFHILLIIYIYKFYFVIKLTCHKFYHICFKTLIDRNHDSKAHTLTDHIRKTYIH